MLRVEQGVAQGDRSAIIRAVHGSHSWAIFGSFSSIWQRNKQKGTKNIMENDVKIVTPGKGKSEKWSKILPKLLFFSPGILPKR